MRRDAGAADRGGMNQSHTRTLVISALVASLGPLVGNGLYAGPGSVDGDKILAEYADGLPTIGYVALSLEVTGFCALAVFLACLVVRTYSVAPVAAVTAAVAGSAMLAVKLGSVGPWMVVIDGADGLDPGVAEALMALTDMAFVVSGLLLCLALSAAGIGLLRTDLPRFLAWWPAVLGPIGVVAGAVGVVAPGSFVPVPYLLLLVWMIALAIATTMSPGRDSSTKGANESFNHVAATQ